MRTALPIMGTAQKSLGHCVCQDGNPCHVCQCFWVMPHASPLLRSHTVPRPIPPIVWYTEVNVSHNA
jgi:hypothetical protein